MFLKRLIFIFFKIAGLLSDEEYDKYKEYKWNYFLKIQTYLDKNIEFDEQNEREQVL